MRSGLRLITYSILASLLLCAALCAPITVGAEEYYDIRIGTEIITDSDTVVSGECGTASYDPDTRTLTLDGLVSSCGIYADAPGGLNIYIKDECVIASDGGYGIYATGDLCVLADEGASLRVGAADGLGIGGVSRAIHAGGTLSLLSGRITAVGGSAVDYSVGISSSTDIFIDGADVVARGGDTDLMSAGIYVSVNQPDSSPTASAGFALLSGSLDASSGASEESVAVYTEGNTYIRGGDFIAEGGVAIDAYGIDVSEYFMPYVVVGDDRESSEVWSGGTLVGYSYVSVSRRITVSTEESRYGRISVDNVYASVGERVAVSISPVAGYELVYACATSELGEEIAVEDDGFVMPDSPVCVSAVFRAIPAAEISVKDIISSGNLEYGYNEGEGYLSVTVELAGGVGTDGYDFSYQWYDITLGTPHLIVGAVFPTYYLPLGMDVGSYSYYCHVVAQRRDNGLYTEADSDAVGVSVGIRGVNVPRADERNFVYNGVTQRYEIEDSPFYTVSGNERVRAGEYTVTVSLVDKEKCRWQGGGVDDLKYSFVIERASAVITLDTELIELRYGEPIMLPAASASLGIAVCDTRASDISDVGEYSVKYTVLETNDYTGDEKTLIVRVIRAVYDMSGVEFYDKSFYKSGAEYSIFIDGVLPCGVTVSYIGNGVSEVGEYTVTAVFKGSDNYEIIPDMTAKITVLEAPIPEGSDTPGEGGETDTEPPSAEEGEEVGNGATDDTDGFDGEPDNITSDGSNPPSSDGIYLPIIIIVASVLSVGIALAAIILVIIKRRRDSLWEEYSKKK